MRGKSSHPAGRNLSESVSELVDSSQDSCTLSRTIVPLSGYHWEHKSQSLAGLQENQPKKLEMSDGQRYTKQMQAKKKIRAVLFISAKDEFKAKSIKWDTGIHFIMIRAPSTTKL